jgi:N6-adenosine-specific RNA methylase IME4
MIPSKEDQEFTQLKSSLRALYKKYGKFKTLLLDPPWRFNNHTGKGTPEHKRLSQYATLSMVALRNLPLSQLTEKDAHIYCWVPNALISAGLTQMGVWGFDYKTMLIWHKIRKDGGSDGRGMGFYFRNVTEVCLFGVKGKLRTLQAGRTQVNYFAEPKREHSRKPEALYEIIERCSPGPYLELFARHRRKGWVSWGNEISS